MTAPRRPRYAHAVLGGTFDRLHAGHAALLAAAMAAGRRVSVGVTTDAFVRQLGKPRASAIQPYATRRRALARWFGRRYPGRWRLVPLADRFGRSVGPGVDVLVVSAETAGGGERVNAERRRLGRPLVPVIVVPLVLADDLAPVSSRRIRAGEIDRTGRRRAPLPMGLAVDDPADARPATLGARRAIPAARVRIRSVGRMRDPSPAERARRLAERALGRYEFALGIARRPRGGWFAVVRSRTVALDPVAIPGRSGRDLARGVALLVRPARPQSL